MCTISCNVYISCQTQHCICVLAQFQLIPYDLHAQSKIAPPGCIFGPLGLRELSKATDITLCMVLDGNKMVLRFTALLH